MSVTVIVLGLPQVPSALETEAAETTLAPALSVLYDAPAPDPEPPLCTGYTVMKLVIVEVDSTV